MYAVLALLLVSLSGSFAFKAGDCSKSTALETLDLKSLEGKWYEFASYGTPLNQRLQRCFSSTITAGSNGKSFTMANDRVIKLFNTHFKSNWTLEAKEEKMNGDLNLSFQLPLIGRVTVPVKVLGTDDYKSYIILHACYSVASIFKSNIGYLFTRKRHYKAKELESLYSSVDETLKKNGISRSEFNLSDQSNCVDESSSNSNTETTPDKTANQPSSSQTNGAVEEGKTSEKASSEQSKADSSSDGNIGVSGNEKAVPSDNEKAATSENANTQSTQETGSDGSAAPIPVSKEGSSSEISVNLMEI